MEVCVSYPTITKICETTVKSKQNTVKMSKHNQYQFEEKKVIQSSYTTE